MKNITRYLGLALKLLVFLLVLGFALKNSQTVIFNAYLGQVWQAPLIVMLGLAFVLGVLTGVLALLPSCSACGAKRPASSVQVEARYAIISIRYARGVTHRWNLKSGGCWHFPCFSCWAGWPRASISSRWSPNPARFPIRIFAA